MRRANKRGAKKAALRNDEGTPSAWVFVAWASGGRARSFIGRDGALTAAPLAPENLAAISPLQKGAVVRMRGGAIAVDHPRDADLEDPAYLDLSILPTIAVPPLGDPPPAAALVDAKKIEARVLLGVGDPPPELASLLKALRAKMTPKKRSGGSSSEGASTSPFGEALSILGTFLAALVARIGPGRAAPSGGSGQGAPESYRGLASVPQEPAAPSLFEQWNARLRHWLAVLLVRMRLAKHIGHRQAEYIQRLMDMFERGDLTEALRHAMPAAKTP